MAPKIDWYYHRKNCQTCSRSQEYLEEIQAQVEHQADARKERFEPEAALALVREASRLYVSKGKKMLTFDMQQNPPSDEELLSAIIGPSGFLRAPVIRIGSRMFVGFSREHFAPLLK